MELGVGGKNEDFLSKRKSPFLETKNEEPRLGLTCGEVDQNRAIRHFSTFFEIFEIFD